MKSLAVGILLAAFCFVTINTKAAMKRLSFDGCKNDSWRVTNVSLESAGDKINVVADIANGSKSTNLTQQVRLTLTGCSKNSKCKEYTNVVVGDVECRAGGPQLDKEACDVAKALAEWEREAAELKADGTKLNFDGGCIDHDAKLGDPAAIDKKVDGTEKTNGRDALELAERMSKLNLTSVV